jgi:GPH family glycoside/pentoside/hexuronide:cation symporter
MFFSIFGGLAAFTVPLAIVGTFRAENAGRVLANGALFGLVSALPLILVFAIAREKKEYAEARPPRLLKTLRAAVKNRPFLFGLGIYLFTWITMDLMQTILLYFLTWCVRRQAQSDLIMGAIFVTAILSLPLWNTVARRWSKRGAYIVGVAFWAAVQLALITLGPGSSLALILALGVLAGIGVGAAHVLPWSILPDAVEWDEWKTGERHEGTFYSLVTLAQKVASSVAIPLALLLLGLLGYRSSASSQPDSALLAIRLITGPIPLVLLGLGILCAALYPINRKMHAAILADLAARRKG